MQPSMANDPAGKSCVWDFIKRVQCVRTFASGFFFFFPQTTAVAALQKQLLKLKNAVFVYYESDLPLRISIIILSACEPTLTHRA